MFPFFDWNSGWFHLLRPVKYMRGKFARVKIPSLRHFKSQVWTTENHYAKDVMLGGWNISSLEENIFYYVRHFYCNIFICHCHTVTCSFFLSLLCNKTGGLIYASCCGLKTLNVTIEFWVMIFCDCSYLTSLQALKSLWFSFQTTSLFELEAWFSQGFYSSWASPSLSVSLWPTEEHGRLVIPGVGVTA